MKKNISYVFLSGVILLFVSCTKKSEDVALPKQTNSTTNANLRVFTNNTRFDGHYKNGSTTDDAFFIRYYPQEVDPYGVPLAPKRPLIITFHGGGFTGGDLQQFELPYSRDGYTNLITRDFLNNKGFAYASANYRLLSTGDGIDIKDLLNDCKDFVIYMQQHSDQYNIDPNKIILMGYSGGASASLWLGLQNNFIPNVTIKGIIALNPQATLNILEWKSQVFAPANCVAAYNMYTSESFIEQNKLWFYDSTDETVINTYSNTNSLSLFNLFDSSDPELYLACSAEQTDVIHHPAHDWALKTHSQAAGHTTNIQFLKSPAYVNPNFESMMQFCARKLQ